MGSTAKGLKKKFTWEDYKTWPDEERWEIIDGEAYNMTPAPTTKHQKITAKLLVLHLKLWEIFGKEPPRQKAPSPAET